ncbi:unnamed protein product [Effrenium voratum]|nr:unnamed protein product [Effrenium voratum]
MTEHGSTPAFALLTDAPGVCTGQRQTVHEPFELDSWWLNPPGLPHQHSLWTPCPEECPVRMHIPQQTCEFTCVNGTPGSCTNPAMNVADLTRKRCRHCETPGCQLCSFDDRCRQCAMGFYLDEDADRCHSRFAFFVPCVYGLLSLALATLFSWYVWLRRLPVINARVLKRALMRRQHLNLRDHTTQRHDWYPLSTNLCRPRADGHTVGGRATTFFFSFQAFVLCWCVCAALGWIVSSWVFSERMLSEGRVSAKKEDVYSICGSTLKQLEADQRRFVKLGKLTYTILLYIFTTCASVAYATYQCRRRVRLDTGEATMKDFALMLSGFPPETGPEVERHRAAFIRQTTGCDPIGVSICWVYDDKEVKELLARETWLWGKGRDSCDMKATSSDLRPSQGQDTGSGPLQVFFQNLTRLLAPPLQPEDTELEARRHEDRATAAAAGATSTSSMYVIFRWEAERDRAKAAFLSDTSVPLYKARYRIRFDRSGNGSEPESVLWQNFAKEVKAVPFRTLASVFGIAVAIMLWGVLFYFPFAMYEAWSYSVLGEPSDFTTETTFSMLVVAGNQILYLLCDKASRFIGFRFASHQLTAYIGLYTLALLSNLAIDMAILFYTTTVAMENLGLDVTSSSFLLNEDERVSYPAIARLGARLMAYNFPACFLLPFLCEALFTLVLPYHVYKKLLGTQPISQKGADACLMPMIFDMSRYADVVLNMTQATVSLFFSPGYVLPTLLGMLLGHTCVFAWDHYRVLRHVRNFRFTSFRTEKAAQRLLSLPGASLSACLVLQLIQVNLVTLSTKNSACLIVAAAGLHTAGYLLVLEFVVPWLGRAHHEPAAQRYEQVAKVFPGNWFNTNPMHCLRSRYVHQHKPPCIFYQIGKEHLLEPNPKLGLFYSAPQWNNEQTSTMVELSRLARQSLGGALVSQAAIHLVQDACSPASGSRIVPGRTRPLGLSTVRGGGGGGGPWSSG